MTDEPNSQNPPPEGPEVALRARTFLKGVVYYDNRRVSIECTVRDLSDTGARVAFSSLVAVPDDIELDIPQKQTTFLARVRRRNQNEIGVSFEDRRADEPRRAVDGEMADRVAKIENELAAMKRLLKKIEAKVLPNDNE